jgi:methylglutaconyl-CoA hydratase
VSLTIEQRGATAVLTIDRPEARNAFDDALIAELTRAVERAGGDAGTRAIVLAATGSVFSSGGDLAWMQRMAAAGRDANRADALGLARLYRTIDVCPKPTVARVQGLVLGGGLGLVAACDIAIAVPEAEFAASEVRIGMVPATVAPYVIRAVGSRVARRLFLTGARIGAEEARRIGLIHEVVPPPELDAAIDREVAAIMAGAAEAQSLSKRLVASLDPIDEATVEATAHLLADVRAGAEAREGFAAFLAKRKPGWLK